MNILAMDTSNQILGVAVLRNGEIAGSSITNINRNHSVRLMPAVERLMKEIGMAPDELDKIIVASGPGSYTGVRIGVTTAKTLAWSLGIPISTVSSLEVLAWQGRFSEHNICSFFDARRGLVYAGVYASENGVPVLDRPEENILMGDLLNRLKDAGEPVVMISPDMAIHRQMIEEILGELAIIPDGSKQFPNPVDLAYSGLGKEPEDVHQVTPNYLRLAEAEAKWIEMKKDLQNHE